MGSSPNANQSVPSTQATYLKISSKSAQRYSGDLCAETLQRQEDQLLLG